MHVGFVGAFACFSYFSLAPFAPSFTDSFFDRQRLMQIGFLSICCVLYLRHIDVSQSFRLKNNWLTLSAVAFLGLGFVSTLNSDEFLDSLLYVLHVAMLIAASVCASRIPEAPMRGALYLLLITHSALICYSLLYLVFAVSDGGGLLPQVIYFGFDNIRFFNQVQIFIMPILVWMLSCIRFGRLALLMLYANLLLMFLGGGLGVLLAWLMVMIGIFCVVSRKLGIHIFLITVLAWAGYMLLQYIALRFGSNKVHMLDVSSGGRVELWSTTIAMLDWSSLLVGQGPGLFAGVHGVSRGAIVFSHPHNVILELLVEWGGLATLVALGILLFVARAYYTTNIVSREIRKFRLVDAIFAAWGGGLAYSFVSGVLVMPVSQTLFFVFTGFLLGLCSATDTEGDASVENGTNNAIVLSKGVSWVIGALLVAYIIMAIYSLIQIDPLQPAFQGPRFWLNGERYLP